MNKRLIVITGDIIDTTPQCFQSLTDIQYEHIMFPERDLHPRDIRLKIREIVDRFNENPNLHIVIYTYHWLVLAELNLLLFAYRAGKKVEENKISTKEIESIIPKKFWINKDEFGAFSWKIGYSMKSLVDTETGMIDANELDDENCESVDSFNTIVDIALGYNIYGK